MILCEYATKFELYGRGNDILEDYRCDKDGDVVVWHWFQLILWYHIGSKYGKTTNMDAAFNISMVIKISIGVEDYVATPILDCFIRVNLTVI